MAAGGVFRVTSDVAQAISGVSKLYSRIEKLEAQVKEFGAKTKSGTDKADKGFKKVTKTVAKVAENTKKAKIQIQQLSRVFSGASKVAMGMSRAFKGISKALMGVRNMYMAVVDAGRLATQGLTNFGRSMFFFVSLPLIGFMKSMLTVAVDFEDQMVRVGKTTGLWGDKLEEVTQGVRHLARNTMISHVELATMAEQIGQLGVKGTGPIIRLTELFNMLAVTTNIAADDVAKKMGKISAAFGWNLNKSQVEVTKLANTINYLENTTAASADEILNALFKVAAVAGTLGISAADATAFATALVSTGFSAEEAGTAVRNLAYYMSQNTKEIHNAMKSNEKYSTEQKVINELNKDFAQVIIDVSDALDDEDEHVNALVNAIEIGNLRGGKALASFGNSFRNLTTIMADARSEWEKGASLLDEYEKAMSSTKAQMGLLRNNINDVGITLGQTFLPYINKIIMVLVPAIRELNDWFAKLASKTKLMYIGFVLLLIIAGPVVMFLGQMMHGVMLLMMGFGQLIKVGSILIGGFGRIASGIGWLFKVISGGTGVVAMLGQGIAGVFAFLTSSIFLWVVGITAAVVLILKILSKLGVDVAGFFTNIAKKATEWGEKLMETYGTGLAKGFQYVLQVITWIANAIASFFQASSPPKAGPLKTIDKWGGKLMSTYLKGFYTADFGILSGIGRIIQKYLTFGKGDDQGKMASALRGVLQARMALSQLIKIYNKTGAIDAGLMAATTKGLGHMTKHVKKLIVLWLAYNKIQERIKELEAERQEIVKGYQEEVEGISASNMSLEDKVNAIRMAQFARDDELRAIDKEKAALEDQADAAQENLKWQQQFVNAMMDQDDLMNRLSQAIERMATAMESMGGLGGDIGTELKKSLEEAQEAFATLQMRLGEGQVLWDTFKKGFRGEEIDWIGLKGTVSPETFLNMMKLYDIGVKVGEVWDSLVATWETLQQWGVRVSTAWATVRNIFLEIKTAILGDEEEGKVGVAGFWESMLSPDWDEVEKNLTEKVKWLLFGVMQGVIGSFVDDDTQRDQLSARWVYILLDVDAILTRLKEMAGDIVSGIWSAMVTTVNERKAAWAADLKVAFENAIKLMLLTILGPITRGGGETFEGFWQGFKDKVAELLPSFTKKVEEIIQSIKEALGIASPSTIMYDIGIDLLQGLWDGMVSKWTEVTAWFSNLLSQIPLWIRIALGMASPSKVMEKLGEQTMEGYLIGLGSMDADIKGSILHTAAVAPLAAASVMGIGAGGGGGISIIINDPVVREDSDLDRLAEMVAEKLGQAINTQQSYGGHTNW